MTKTLSINKDNVRTTREDITKAQVRDLPDVDPRAPEVSESQQTQVGLLLERKKNRCIRTILGNKERDIDPHIDEETSARFRKVVLDEINGLIEFVKDVIVSAPEGQHVVVNDLYLQKIDDLHRHILGD
jgi:hypothetical protein